MSKYYPGQYRAVAPGNQSLIAVNVCVCENYIEYIEYDHQEPAKIDARAIDHVAKSIFEMQSADVHSVLGAAAVSVGLKEAVRKALAVAEVKI